MTKTTEAQEVQTDETCTMDEHCKAHTDTDCPDPEDWTLAFKDQWLAEQND